ncbi:hypothetical protein GCM10027589_59130 [Actinocorallia lasiicapitis]
MHSVRIAAALCLTAALTTGCTVSASTSTKTKPSKSGTSKSSSGKSTSSPKTKISASAENRPAARRVVSAPTAGGLGKGTGAKAVTDVPVDLGQVPPGSTVVVENYVQPGGDTILVVALDGISDSYDRREHLWRGLLDRVGWDGGVDSRPVPAGPLGGDVECFLVSLAEDGNVICGWSDASTVGVALIPNLDLKTAAQAFVDMRSDLER